MKKNIIYLIITSFIFCFVGCDNDDVDKHNSIFDNEELKAQNEFDEWIYENLIAPYNINVKYRYDFMDSKFDFNLTPASFEKASSFTQIIKYCWIECYDEVAGIDFMKNTAPREIVLVGSQALDYTIGTTTLGHAEGGTTVTLYKLNEITEYDFESIIKYMHIMHHEFSHILDQRKKMDPLFGQISMKDYLGEAWVKHEELFKDKGGFLKVGFVSDYASSSEGEDFAEVYAQYLTQSYDQWEATLEGAITYDDKGKVVTSSGKEAILAKLQFVRDYLAESWGIDIEELKASVQRRAERAKRLEILTFDEFSK